MSNVLPNAAKKAVWSMYRARSIIAGSLMLLCVAVFAALVLSPSYVVLAIQHANVVPEQSGTPASIEDRAAIIHTQALIAAFSPLIATSTASTLIVQALALRPADISINHITATAGHPGTLILSGSAVQIASISVYQNALRASKLFSTISVPVGDLAGTADGTFSITLSAIF